MMGRGLLLATVAVVGLLSYQASAQMIFPERMNLGHYNKETKKYEKTRIHLGGDDHDLKPHVHLLGEGDHDYKPHHRQHVLGGDDHDLKPHVRPLIGGDDHDLKPHTRPLIGGDDHDKKPHRRQHIFGGGDHDYKPHTRPLIGGDDHDLKPHVRPLIGGDDHDKKPHHRQHILGGGDHDLKPHVRPLIGGDDHDKKPHHRQHILGGGDHDYKPHHRTHILGGGDHDMKPHTRPLLGADGHDLKPHVRVSAVNAFRNFMLTHQKEYHNQTEFSKRFSIFRQNLQRVKQLRRSERGSATYGVTQFADLTEEEFKSMLGFRPSLRRPSPHRRPLSLDELPTDPLPKSFDWREHGAVTPVKNQGMCGSCWAFSTTGNVEGQWALKNKKLVSLSEQELVDCDSEDHGCEGGLPENAYDAIMKLGGLESEEAYPYNGHDGQCHLETTKVLVTVNGSVELPQDEAQMAQWLATNGPISIGINANPLQFYRGGVAHPMKFLCNPDAIDHGVLIVGYGVHVTKYLHRVQPYWLVKNSWGTGWGEQGYFRVYRGDGTCGVNQMATSSIVP